MGNTNQASHKHLRGDSMRPHLQNQISSGSVGYPVAGAPGAGGFMYPSEDLAEEFEDHTYNSQYSKNSYSPGDSVPTFRFPSRTDSMSIRSTTEHQSKVNKKIPVVFKYTGKNCKDVYLIGSFTNWKEKISMIKSDGDYITIVELPEGEHQYKFVVDGKWEHDPTQPSIDDTFNGKNNVVTVKKSDFEVMDALAMDSVQQQSQKAANDDLSKSPTGEYTEDIPIRGLNSITMDKPPYLPPQLLNIVLNKDTSASCEPALLPEPNHVMLKHLYALSIRDGVMVLSSTFRHKQKFITTCFYKPI